jgi:hypothetical protein
MKITSFRMFHFEKEDFNNKFFCQINFINLSLLNEMFVMTNMIVSMRGTPVFIFNFSSKLNKTKKKLET